MSALLEAVTGHYGERNNEFAKFQGVWTYSDQIKNRQRFGENGTEQTIYDQQLVFVFKGYNIGAARAPADSRNLT